MTSDEIKRTTTMNKVLWRYGLKADRHGMLSCPFHGKDQHASMKIYKDGFNCFACGANGDIFAFVMEYEGVSFKQAFQILGGTYEHAAPEERRKASLDVKRRKLQAESERRKAERKKQELKERNIAITIYRKLLTTVEPTSDLWVRWSFRLWDLEHQIEWELDI